MGKTITIPIREDKRMKGKLPITLKEYKKAWLNLERLGKKINRLWKIKKYSFEILREERE